MDIGTPLPADLDEIFAGATLNSQPPEIRDAFIKRLHATHAGYDGEAAAIHQKKLAVKKVLTKLYANRALAQRASFDSVIAQGGDKDLMDWTPQGAREMLANVAKGIFQLPTTFIDKLKEIASKGDK